MYIPTYPCAHIHQNTHTYTLHQECRKLGVECIVAPYEADAQLAYLQKEGIVDFVITEDSDLLVFGCQRVLYKMDESGKGKLIELQDLGKANNVLIVSPPKPGWLVSLLTLMIV